MATVQIGASVQNDGNFAHLDQFDPVSGLVKRIEVFRSSQPVGRYGVTGCGTPVDVLCGADHLTARSNQVHRSIYSEGQRGERPAVLLEGREEMNPEGFPEGSWDVRVRDLDAASETFGQVVRLVVAPSGEKGYELSYELRRQEARPQLLSSPLLQPVTALARELPDLGAPPEQLPETVALAGESALRFTLGHDANRGDVDAALASWTELAAKEGNSRFAENVDSFLQFGDLGPKSVHPGTNLIGDCRELVSDYLVWRKYRAEMISLGRLYVGEMAGAVEGAAGPLRRNRNNTRPGVYSLYILAYKLGISLYQLVLDKVYSDYGGVPMELRPGSRIETGREPVVDATAALRTVADLADIFYLRT